MTENTADDLEQNTLDGWVRKDRIAGMDTVGEDGYDGCSGGYKCENCDHYVPIEAIDDDVCPACGSRGMIGTVVAGVQEITVLSPEGWFHDG